MKKPRASFFSANPLEKLVLFDAPFGIIRFSSAEKTNLLGQLFPTIKFLDWWQTNGQ